MSLPGNLHIALLFSATLFALSCHQKPDLATEEKAIRSILATERKAHFDRNVDLFISEFADSMLSVNKGKVTIATPGENRKRIEPYFNSVTFIKWDDVAEPIIRLSDDGSLAYAVVQKEVILTYPDSLGKAFYDTTHYAWTSIYRKQKGEWKVEANISTTK
jgi:hypothetical protein